MGVLNINRNGNGGGNIKLSVKPSLPSKIPSKASNWSWFATTAILVLGTCLLLAQTPAPAPTRLASPGSTPGATPASDQLPPTVQDKDADEFTIRGTFKYVMVPVTVSNHDGTIVTGVSASEFRLTDNGKPQRITEDLSSHPLSLVIAIQANAVVEKMLPQIQKLGSLIQSQVIGDEGEAAVLAFDHRIQKLTDFTSDPDKLSMALKNLKPGSSTSAMNDAALEGINLLKSRPASRRRALLLISESRDNGSELRPREVLTQADFANVVIYSVDISHLIAAATASPSATRSVLDNRPPGAVHLPAGNVETPTSQSQNAMGNWVPVLDEIYRSAKGLFVKNPLQIYTTYTGGREFPYGTQRELERAMTAIGEELHGQYLLTYSPNNQDEAGFHNIVVTVQRPDLKIRARDGYYLAGKPQ